MKKLFCKHTPMTTQHVNVVWLAQVKNENLGDLSDTFVTVGVQVLFVHAGITTCEKCDRVLSEPATSKIGICSQTYRIPLDKLPLRLENGKIDVERAAARWLRYWAERGDLTADGCSETLRATVEGLGGSVEVTNWADLTKS